MLVSVLATATSAEPVKRFAILDNNPALPHSGQLCFSRAIRDQIFEDAKAFLTGKSAKETQEKQNEEIKAWVKKTGR